MSDPVRLGLSADAPPLAVSALERARSDAPDAARLSSIEAGVLAKLGLPPGDGGGPNGGDGGGGSAGGGGSGTAIMKAGAATLAVGAVVAAVVVASRSPSTVASPIATAPATAPSDAAPAASVVEAPPAEHPTMSVDDLPSVAATAIASRAPGAPAVSAQDPAELERAEVALLARAQSTLSSQPAETLARCEEHARRFARGTLVQEREVLAIDALVRLDRRAEAEARAARFRQAFPKSGHQRRIETLLAR